MARSSDGDEVLADADGRLHHLVFPAFKSGFQGDVYLTREPNIAVKILKQGPRAADIIRDVRRLPIEDLTSVAAPLSTLQDRPGYVMVWLRGMVPLSVDRLPNRARRPEIVEWYIATGGLRRRLALTARLAEVIADLHGRGLVYVDLSLANVMVSETGSAAEVRLIDLDNLRFATDRSLSVLTERWAAPELFDPTPPSRHTDSYSMALVAFTTLTGYHPFEDGDLVRYTPDGSPQRHAAARGQVPSFIDPDDMSNATSNHLFPIDLVLTPRLLAMFRRAFGPGRRQVEARPTAAAMRRLLWEAHDRTVACECGFTTYLDAGACASCRRPFEEAFIVEVLASDSARPAATIAVGSKPVAINRRHLPLPVEPRSRHEEVAQVSVERGAVALETSPGWSVTSRTLRSQEQTALEQSDGTSLLLRAVMHAG